MRIESVKAFLLSCPLPEPLVLPYYGGERTILKRDAMLIRVESHNGLVGYAPGPAHEQALREIEQTIAPFLQGRELRDPDALRILFQLQPGLAPSLLKTYAAVEIALCDLTAKALGVPLADLLGGRLRDNIRVYASAGMYQPPQGYAEEAAGLADLGFTAYKFRPGLGPDEDLEILRHIRDTAGPDLELMADAHTWTRMGDRSYSEETVHRLAREMGAMQLAWLEEPLNPHHHAALARLREAGHVPIASGEHEPGEAGFGDLIATGAADIVQADLVCQGGYTLLRRLFGAVESAGLCFAFHSWGTALEVIAAAHIGVCWPENVVPWLEVPCYRTDGQPGMYPFPLAREILREPLQIARGALRLDLSQPGLGVDIDESVVARYPWIPGPWSFFRFDSPAETHAVTGDHSVRWA